MGVLIVFGLDSGLPGVVGYGIGWQAWVGRLGLVEGCYTLCGRFRSRWLMIALVCSQVGSRLCLWNMK